jgi:glycosyltransferase 2 family protein
MSPVKSGAKRTRARAGKLVASAIVTVLCLYYALRGVDRSQVVAELRSLAPSGIALYVVTLAVTHFFRSWRWEFLLRPMGVRVPLARLMTISSVGFMAILALPMRLGEFVRPYFVAREGHVRMSAALGTVAVERIIDGLVISIVFFVSYCAAPVGTFPAALRVAAWLSLAGFVGLTAFLALALWRSEFTIQLALRVTLLRRLAPRRADHVADRLRALISGFRVLADVANLTRFLWGTLAYWACNGIGMWLLARAMGLPISLSAAFMTMAFTGVVLTLPNAPGLVGQFHAGIKMALGAYLPAAVVNGKGLAYAIVLHGIQTIWYVAVGVAAFAWLATRQQGHRQSLRDAVAASNRAADAPEAEPAA